MTDARRYKRIYFQTVKLAKGRDIRCQYAPFVDQANINQWYQNCITFCTLGNTEHSNAIHLLRKTINLRTLFLLLYSGIRRTARSKGLHFNSNSMQFRYSACHGPNKDYIEKIH